jgi:hypothetical protein
MPAHPITDAKGPFEVHSGPNGKAPQRASLERFGRYIREEPVWQHLGYGQADAVDGHGIPDCSNGQLGFYQ